VTYLICFMDDYSRLICHGHPPTAPTSVTKKRPAVSNNARTWPSPEALLNWTAVPPRPSSNLRAARNERRDYRPVHEEDHPAA